MRLLLLKRARASLWRSVALCLLCFSSAAGFAEEELEEAHKRLPIWELGIGLGGLDFADYPGANHRSRYVLPFPRVIYRGKYIRANRGGIRGRLYSSRWLELDLSTGGNLPANSDDNPSREGMPDLNPGFELGPSLRIKFLDEDLYSLQLRLNARALITIEDIGNWEYQGVLFHPELRWEQVLSDRAALISSVESRYGDEDFHNYYYGVAPAYATADRPEYLADSGFGGYGVNIRLRWSVDRDWRVSAGVRYYDLGDAVFNDSPLFERNSASYFYMSVSRILWRSSRTRAFP